MSEIPDNAPPPRLCHVVKWKHFNGYGFNLHADKAKAGQYIGKVDVGSPAERAGLKEGDRIVEVNNVNIANENHKQVVQRIKAVDNETKLLVVDHEADKFYKSHNIVVNKDMPNIVYGTSMLSNANTLDDADNISSKSDNKTSTTSKTNGHHDEDNRSVGSAASSSIHSDSSAHSQSQHNTKDVENAADFVVPPPPPVLIEHDQEDSPKFSKRSSISSKNSSRGSRNSVGLEISHENRDSVEISPVSSAKSSPEVAPKTPKETSFQKVEANSLDDPSPPDVLETYDNIAIVNENAQKGVEDRKSSVSSSSGSSPSLHGDEVSTQSHQDNVKSQMSTSPSPPPSIDSSANSKSVSPNVNAKNTKNIGGLNLNMSVAEMKEHLKRNRKQDPRTNANAGIDLKEKYKIIQSL